MRIFMKKKAHQITSSYALHRMIQNLISRMELNLNKVLNLGGMPLSYEDAKHQSMARVYLTAAVMELSKIKPQGSRHHCQNNGSM